MTKLIKCSSMPVILEEDAAAVLRNEFGIPNDFEQKLPFLSKNYNISDKISDYFLVPVIMFHSNIANRNGYMFPTESLIEWNNDRFCLAYESWKYAPLHVEHKSEDITKAIGVIADVSIKKEVGYSDDSIYKVIALAAVDRTKEKKLAADIESGKRNSWSMGCNATHIFCSYCGATQGQCTHINDTDGVIFYQLNGKIVCRAASGLSGIELSSVGTPAFAMAVNNKVKPYARIEK